MSFGWLGKPGRVRQGQEKRLTVTTVSLSPVYYMSGLVPLRTGILWGQGNLRTPGALPGVVNLCMTAVVDNEEGVG